LVHQHKVWKEIEAAIGKVDANKYKTKISEEKGMEGKHLFSPIELNKRFTTEFRKMGWSESRTSYWVTDEYDLIRKTLHLSAEDQKKEIEKAGHKAILTRQILSRTESRLKFNLGSTVSSRTICSSSTWLSTFAMPSTSASRYCP